MVLGLVPPTPNIPPSYIQVSKLFAREYLYIKLKRGSVKICRGIKMDSISLYYV